MNNINRHIYTRASKRVIKTVIYKKVSLPLVSNNECRSGKTKKCCMKIYPTLFCTLHYVQKAPSASRSLHRQSKSLQVSLKNTNMTVT